MPDASWNMCADALLLSPLIAFLEKEDMATRFTSVVSYGVLCSRNIKRDIYLSHIHHNQTYIFSQLLCSSDICQSPVFFWKCSWQQLVADTYLYGWIHL